MTAAIITGALVLIALLDAKDQQAAARRAERELSMERVDRLVSIDRLALQFADEAARWRERERERKRRGSVYGGYGETPDWKLADPQRYCAHLPGHGPAGTLVPCIHCGAMVLA